MSDKAVVENSAPDTARRGPIRDALGRVRGGNPGNKGGTGRPPNELRAVLRNGLEAELKRMEAAAKKIDRLGDPEKSFNARRALAEFRAKYGLGTTQTQTDTEGRDVTVRVVRDTAARPLSGDN